MSTRKTEASWVESRQRWQINVQRNGQRRTFTSSVRGKRGKIEAEQKADSWLADRTTGESTKLSVVANGYLEHVEAATSHGYWIQQKQYIDAYINPRIGNKKISALTENDLQGVIDAAYKHGLSRKSLQNLRACIMAVIKYARRSKYTKFIPEGLIIPAGAKKSEKEILPVEDLRKLFSMSATTYRGKIVAEDWYINAYRLIVLTGLRPGELFGLKWDDVAGSTLRVKRSVNKFREVTQGKNDNAQRNIVLTGLAAEVLEAQREKMKKEGCLKLKWVFPDPDRGDASGHEKFFLYFRRYKRYNNFCSDTSPYELRHTYVSVCDDMPIGLKKKVVGHSQSMDTEGIYGHQKAGDLARAAQYSDNAFKRFLNIDGSTVNDDAP